ncbi:MAG: hypothetical protein MSA56_00245 [Clostridium sp.]|nr:hypothetical protein [Clostridium sp.]
MNNFSPTGAATNRFTPSIFLTPQGKNIGKETVQECMWKEIHEMYQDWYNNIDRKIKKY